MGAADIELRYYDHAILYAIFEILIERGCEFRILSGKVDDR